MQSTIRYVGMAVLAGALLTPALAAAQAPPQAKPPLAPEKKLSDPKDCVHTGATVGEGGGVKNPDGRPLSQQLARSNGVICPPPHTDREMAKPAPGGGTMPVIPPPGRDENHKGIEPK